ncbi:MAG: hypothetical protein ACPG5V_00735 [Vibrio cyclitrophicus]
MSKSLEIALNKAASLSDGVDAGAVVAGFQENMEARKQKRLENASNGVMDTGNTGFGAEGTVDVEYTEEMYSMIHELPGLLNWLPANHGQKKADGSIKVGVIGEAALWNGVSQPTGVKNSQGGADTDNAIATAEIEIKLRDVRTIIGIPKRKLHSATESNFISIVQNRILLGFKRTIEAMIVNSDPTNGDGNVNYLVNGASPDAFNANSYYFGGGEGIRKAGIDNVVVGGNEVISRSILLDMIQKLDNVDDFGNLMWLGQSKLYSMIAGMPEYATLDKTANNANDKGKVRTMEGIELYIAKDHPSLVSVSGKIETGADKANDFRALQLLHRYGPQYAFGRDMEIVVTEDSQTMFFDCAGSFGVGMHNEKAGMGKTVATGIFQK